MNLGDFLAYARNFFYWFYDWTNSIYPFTDYDVSLFWICESLLLTHFVWRLFPVDTDFEEDAEIYDSDTSTFYEGGYKNI